MEHARFERISTWLPATGHTDRTGLPAIGRNCFDYQSAHTCSAESTKHKGEDRATADRREHMNAYVRTIGPTYTYAERL